MKYAHWIIWILLTGCAQISILTGGADDVYAPEIDSAKTFPVNGQTNFTGDRVHLKFKEYITLVKPNDNIIITPRPGITPTYTAHNKTLEILFHEPLAENTTYTINFNRAVADITERNDSIFQYVFSTGSYIDSLAVKGRVTDAFTNRPSADFLVALYPMQNEVQFDSIPYKLKPTYISQTDASGQFRLNYLKYGVYYLFAIHDKNKNLLLDSDEAFAFMPERTILVNNDYAYVSMKSFERESGNAQVEKVNFTAPGKVEILFTAAPDSFDIKTSCELLREETGSRDSLVYWLATNPTPKMRFEVVINGVADTLKPLYKSSPVSIRALLLESNIQEGKIMPDEMLELTFSEPVSLSSINPEGIKILNPDSTFTPVSFELKNLRTLVIADTSGKPVTLVVDSAAVSSVYGAAVQKTQSFTFEKYQSSYYGSLIVTTDSVFTSPCLVYLLNANGESIDTAVYSPRFVFENLVPGDYQLRLVVDEDQNGYWTTGSFQEARIPEKVIYFNETIQVKSKWEKEVDWLLKSSEN